jgi:peroxiredoxin-like protein
MPTYEYPVNVKWTGGRDGAGAILPERSGTELNVKVPPEFHGPGGGTNPEELLTSAIVGCYTITFGIIAANRKLPVLNIETSAVGQVEQNGANFTFTAVTIRPMITVSGDSTDAQIEATRDMAIKTDSYCIVGNSVRDKVRITIEPNVVRALN